MAKNEESGTDDTPLFAEGSLRLARQGRRLPLRGQYVENALDLIPSELRSTTWSSEVRKRR